MKRHVRRANLGSTRLGEGTKVRSTVSNSMRWLWAFAIAVSIGLTSEAAFADTTIYDCVTNSTGADRIVSAATICTTKEHKISWSIAGPIGPQGPIGLTGAAGTTDAVGPIGPIGA